MLWVICASVIAEVELPLFNRYGEDAGNALLDLGNALLYLGNALLVAAI
ncbi:hypothetical protein [Shewanella marisflavi]